MAAIGILGGMGPQASAHLHALLIRDAPKHISITSETDFPEIVLLSVPVPNFISNKHNFSKTKQILIGKVSLLEQAGCIVNGIACNTAHLLLPDLQAATGVPFLSIPALVAAHISRAGFKRVGLLATPTTLDSTLYDETLDTSIVKLVRPSAAIATKLEKLIFKQLHGDIKPADQAALRRIAEKFIADRKLDAVILGCTELPLIFGESEDARVIDTLRVLSDGLLHAYFTDTAARS
ncbi:MAG TPA: amino acid racemase [Patescibacteria group bacterium]|nr:amino acid racemase [Patescibacteria group bacterium]